LQRLQGGFESCDLTEQRLVGPGRLAPLVDQVLDAGGVGQDQLELEDLEVVKGVGAAHDVLVLEGPQHQADGIDLADAGQEPVSQTLARRRPGDESGDVDELDARGHDLLALAHLGQGQETGVGDLGDADVGLGGRERMGRHRRRASGQRVEQRRLAGVGQPDEPQALHFLEPTGRRYP
jgi:hypothetical protein